MISRWMAAAALGLIGFAAQASPRRDTNFLIPDIKVGEHFSNVFSIASSIKADGFDELVRRNSGSADYTLTQASADHALTFEEHGVYDGSSDHLGQSVLRDQGAIACSKDHCHTYTDASGLIYNRLMWGQPPAALKDGMVWTVTMDQPWELGAAGLQTVTVVHVDDTDGVVTLKREGTATGAFAGELLTTTLVKDGRNVTLDVTPGQAHWTGYTTFRHGIVLSDELLVTRADKLNSKETGWVNATKRRYMLLNAAPYPTL